MIDLVRSGITRDLVHARATNLAAARRVFAVRWLLRAQSALGLLLPLFLGTYVMKFGPDSVVETVRVLAGILALAMLPIAVWGLIAKWDDVLSNALQSSVANRGYADELQSLLDRPTENAQELSEAHVAIKKRAETQNADDEKAGYIPWERRRGHREALKLLSMKCTTCQSDPALEPPGSCGTCGKLGMIHYCLGRWLSD